MPPLTEIKIKSIKPTEKTRRFFDGGGLYLEVTKAGSKYWRWKYRINGKEKRLAFGVWPEVSLREARDKRDECRAKLRAGEDPGEKKEKGAKFEAIAEAWRKNMGSFRAKVVKDRRGYLNFAIPSAGVRFFDLDHHGLVQNLATDGRKDFILAGIEAVLEI